MADLCAYGWEGPWARRRGFDSLVQMSSGIASEGAEVAGGEPGRVLLEVDEVEVAAAADPVQEVALPPGVIADP